MRRWEQRSDTSFQHCSDNDNIQPVQEEIVQEHSSQILTSDKDNLLNSDDSSSSNVSYASDINNYSDSEYESQSDTSVSNSNEICTENEAIDSCQNETAEDEVCESTQLMLYEGCKFSKDEAILMVMEHYITNKQTKSALQSFLSTVHKLLPEKNDLPTSNYQLFNYLKKLAPVKKAEKFYYCKNCEGLLT